MVTSPAAASMTLVASATTSGPMPSPPMTATRMLFPALGPVTGGTLLACNKSQDRRPATSVLTQVHHAGHGGPNGLGDLRQHVRRHRAVHGQGDQRLTAAGIPADLHPGDVDAPAAENLADD